MPETLQQTVPDELAGQRLDAALARMFPEYSRSRLTAWLKDGHVTVDGRSPRPRDPVSGGEAVVVRPQSEPVLDSEPEPLDLTVRHEDVDAVVIDKPAGLVVHPGAGNPRGSSRSSG